MPTSTPGDRSREALRRSRVAVRRPEGRRAGAIIVTDGRPDEAADESFDRLVRARSAALQRTAYLLTGDHHLAEDLVQATLAKTYTRWGRLRDPAAGEAYARRVMVSLATRWWSRRWRGERPTALLPEQVELRDEAGEVVARELARVLLAGLGPRQRAVVVLRFYEDLSERETAELLGMAVGTVKSTTSAALVRLRELAAAHGADGADAAEGAGGGPR